MPDPASLLDGAPLDLASRASVEPLLARWPQPLAGYTFAALATWREVFDYRWRVVGPDTLVISCGFAGGERHLLQPLGPVGPDLVARIEATARALDRPLRIVGVSEAFLAENAALVARFSVSADRDQAQYVYAARDLADLPGRRFSAKRNLLAQASRLGWTVEPLDVSNSAACPAVLDAAWQGLMAREAPSLAQEDRAVRHALARIQDLGLEGLLVRLDGRAAAFSLFERQTPDTAVVHFERALREPRGLYQVVNRETARVLAARGFTWINREEDVGDPGLRRAKESYFPARLEPFHVLTWKG